MQDHPDLTNFRRLLETAERAVTMAEWMRRRAEARGDAREVARLTHAIESLITAVNQYIVPPEVQP